MNTIPMGHNLCPKCGALIDACTDAYGDAVPVAGDFTVCIYCAQILRFADDMEIYMPTADELKVCHDLSPEDVHDLFRAQNAVLAYHKEHGKPTPHE